MRFWLPSQDPSPPLSLPHSLWFVPPPHPPRGFQLLTWPPRPSPAYVTLSEASGCCSPPSKTHGSKSSAGNHGYTYSLDSLPPANHYFPWSL